MLFKKLSEVFSIDLRSLAITRMGVAIIIVLDIVSRFRDISFFYGDGSVMPASILHSFWTGEWAWSVHALFGGVWHWIAILFGVQFVLALLLFFGYWTRTVTVLTWFLLTSLHNANPLMLQGGDFLLRAILFVCMFLPWGNAFSVDSAHAKRGHASFTILSGWSVAYLLQIGLFYLFASLFKSSPEWTEAGSAVYYALSIDQYATPLAKFIVQFPDLLTVLTFSILTFQHFVIFMLFSPILTPYIRTFATLALMFMHLSFAALMHLGMFSWVAVAALFGFITKDVWKLRVMRGTQTFLEKCFEKASEFFPGVSFGPFSYFRSARAVVLSVLSMLYIVYIFVWQASNVIRLNDYLPRDWELPAKILRIDQRWNLFAPHPYRDDGWFVIPGTLENGSVVDLYKGGAPLSFEKPDDYYAFYPTTRWRKYGIEIRNSRNVEYRPYYAHYLCQTWNEVHNGPDRLNQVEIVYMMDVTPPPGSPPPTVRPVSLLRWDCANEI